MPRKKIPSHRRHVTGQGTVRLGGKDYYTGRWGTPEAELEYGRLVAEWLARRGAASPTGLPAAHPDMLVCELLALYEEHARTVKYVQGGRPTRQYERVKRSLSHVRRLYGDTRLRDFGPLALQAVRGEFVRAGWTRGHVNSCVGVIKTMFRWALGKQLVGGDQYHAVEGVASLPKGEPGVRPSKEVGPARLDHVCRTLAEAIEVVADLARVQYLTGMRAGEVCAMRPRDIDRQGTDPNGKRHLGTWTYTPPHHKTARRGGVRCVFLGPKAQTILTRYLDGRVADLHLFSPREAVRAWLAARKRKERLRRKRAPGTVYTTNAVDKALRSAAARAGVPCWSTHQLRHLRATEVRAKFTPDHARIVLGHSLPGVTGGYAREDWSKAAEVARKTG